ncbi:basic amino acid ABC transporter substrate-binding protein [Aneurinibacillus aneurinilyticus]|jgi:polar amino acid transport system substrate-binding protein|nr:basic amino acid ABC transporter substrate-binding protein [Aneurinibacillus aneurinilyticus]MCI1692296.1 basic amino acid ABC transporter substrate-binding protein [Aneurinibacillus aneurinilyticus]MED0669222.1 basic amino acid ABC transporter substrate-binding protein [Aneurinibacillus aneurinilyticus]MED0707936.1 basic amino acid ABC transporter substrate-binding protein [Aneurinibacillus aneurinilyticus]MED0722349.1 basic amino acid ABC transporter substrate-binding protein [Aneurinibaci
MKKKFSLLFLACLFVFALAGCGGGAKEGSTSASGKKITVGTDASFPPFEFMSPTGEPQGFDIDLIKAIAETQNIEVQVKHTGWDAMMAGLEDGSVDVGIAGITITKERKKSFDFTTPYFTAKQVILMKKNAPAVSKVADLKGKKIGVQSGTTGQFLVEKHLGKGYSGLKGFEEVAGAIEDMKNGRIDAVVADNAVVKKFMEQLKLDNVNIIEDTSAEQEQYGIAVKKGNKELLDKLNKGLATVKENGKYDEIYNKYLGK